MKKLLLLLTLIPFYSWGQACTTPVNSKDVVIFIDTNTAEPELVEARRGACESGRRFVVIPKNTEEHGRYTVPWLRAHRQEEAICKSGTFEACSEAKAKAKQLKRDYDQFKRNTDFNLQAELNRELGDIKSSGGKVSTLIVSGHDGGGFFGSMKGDIHRVTLGNMMEENGLADGVESVILAGCFTAVKEEVNQWRSPFPNLKAIYGYDGYAPLADRPAGHQYIRSALKNDKRLRSSASIAQLNQRISTLLPAVANLSAAAFVTLDCNEEAYMASERGGRRFASYDSGASPECQAGRNELTRISRIVHRYYEGTEEPPRDSNVLRADYSRVRSLQHCFEELGIAMDAQTVFNIRFYYANVENFARFYAEDLAAAEEMLKDLDPEVRQGFWVPTKANLEGKTRAQTLENIHKIYNAVMNASSEKHQQALLWLSQVSTQHLQALDNPFSWHEVTSSDPETPPRLLRLRR